MNVKTRKWPLHEKCKERERKERSREREREREIHIHAEIETQIPIALDITTDAINLDESRCREIAQTCQASSTVGPFQKVWKTDETLLQLTMERKIKMIRQRKERERTR